MNWCNNGLHLEDLSVVVARLGDFAASLRSMKMAKPTFKSEEMEKTLIKMTGIDRRKCITADICTWCGKPAKNFKDAISEKEYRISGFCQKCQDETFGE